MSGSAASGGRSMISLSGVGSGLDIQSLVSQLVAAEGQAKNASLSRRETEYRAQLSALGNLKSSLGNFQSAASKLASSDNLLKFSTSSNGEQYYTATADSTASQGSYSIEVLNLAVANKIASSGFTDKFATVGSGTLTISSGTSSFDVEIPTNVEQPGAQTLQAITDAINAAKDNSTVLASVVTVDDGLGGTEARLVITSRNTGTANSINITVADDDNNSIDSSGLSALAYDVSTGTLNMSELSAAEDAVIKVDTLQVTKASNTIDDVIEGVTLDLAKAEIGTLSSLTVTLDKVATKEGISSFVESYNSLVSTYTKLTAYDSETETAGVLIGDFFTRQVMSGVKELIRSNTGNPSYPTLFSAGIEIDTSGKMSLNSDRIDTLLNNEPETLAAILSGESGIASQVEARIKEVLELGGILDGRSKSINKSIEKIDDERGDLERRLDTVEATLLNQFIAMDTLVAQYGATGSYLTNQLAALPGFSTK